MNDTPELPSDDHDAAKTEGLETPAAAAKTPRKRRAPRAAAAAPDEPVDGNEGGGAPPADSGAAAPAAESRTGAMTADAAAAGNSGEEGSLDAPPADAAAGAASEGGPEGEPSPRGERSRRRGRRDRRRGRAEGADEAMSGGAAGDAEGDGASAEPSPPKEPPPDVGEVFAQVLAGSFDTDSEAEPATVEQAPAKRVLLPEPDAPKLHKVLAQAGVGSRRDLEQMIADGRVTVNGEAAHVGQRISFGDQVKVEGKPVRFRIAPPPPRILAYHKPAGEVVTHDDPQQRPTVFRRLPRLPNGKWQSVGRLDINTEGLLLFTSSGELANQLMHPRFGVEREYAVRVLGSLSEDQREELLDGVLVDGQEASFKSIEEGGGEGANRWYRVVITEGRNREVRKLFEEVGLTVSRLIRIRYGNVVLPRGLRRGAWVEMDADDVRAIRRLATGEGRGQAKPGQGRGPDRGPQGKRGRHDERGRREPSADVDGDDGPIGPIPNPLEQTFDRRFVQKNRGIGGGFGGGSQRGFGSPSSGPKKGGDGPRQPDPLQTSVGYIGADAFHRKGGRGGNRGGGGGFGGGGGGGGGFGGGGRRGR